MLKGTKTAILRRIQPISIHGQVFLDIARQQGLAAE